jgi:hypothetical protein
VNQSSGHHPFPNINTEDVNPSKIAAIRDQIQVLYTEKIVNGPIGDFVFGKPTIVSPEINSPIKPGEMFDPYDYSEVKSIITERSGVERVAALERFNSDYREKIQYQQEGIRKTELEIQKTLTNNPNTT